MNETTTTEEVEAGDTSEAKDTGTPVSGREAFSEEMNTLLEEESEGLSEEDEATSEPTEEVVETESKESAGTSTEQDNSENEEPAVEFTPYEITLADGTVVPVETAEDLIEMADASRNPRNLLRTGTEKHEEANRLLRELEAEKKIFADKTAEFERISGEREEYRRQSEISSLKVMPKPPDPDLNLEDPDKYNLEYAAYVKRQADWVERIISASSNREPVKEPVVPATSEEKDKTWREAVGKAESDWWDDVSFPDEEVAEDVRSRAAVDFGDFQKSIIDQGDFVNPRDMRSFLNETRVKVLSEKGLDITDSAKVAESAKKTVLRQLTQTKKEAPKSAPPSGGGPESESVNPFSDDVSVEDFEKTMKAQKAENGKLDIRTLFAS